MVPKKSHSDVFKEPVEANSGGVIAHIFRRLVIKLGVANRLKHLCKVAQHRDHANRKLMDSSIFDTKLEYRLYQAANSPKMTFETFVKLVTNLFLITEFKFTVSVKLRGSSKWINIEQRVNTEGGPLVDASDLDDLDHSDDYEKHLEDIGESNEKKGTKKSSKRFNSDV